MSPAAFAQGTTVTGTHRISETVARRLCLPRIDAADVFAGAPEWSQGKERPRPRITHENEQINQSSS